MVCSENLRQVTMVGSEGMRRKAVTHKGREIETRS